MKTFIFPGILILCFSVPGPAQSFEPLIWLTGTWVMTKPNGNQRLEIWQKDSSTSLTGKGYKVSGKDTILLETLKIYEDEKDLSTWYVPTVPDQNEGKPVLFKMTRRSDYLFVFENKEHDFPQRITYHFHPRNIGTPISITSNDSIIVRVEDFKGDGIDFRFGRK